MMWTSSVLLFGFIFSVHSSSLRLPPYIKACKKDSPDLETCAYENGKLAIPYILKGDRKYGFPNFYPMKVDEINLETAGNLSLKLKDVEIFGQDRIILKRFKIDLAAEKIFFDSAIDEMIILGKYDIDGKILVLPLKGHGDANITAIGAEYQFEFKYKSILKNGEEYLVVDNQKVEFTLKRMYFNFDNLFNGDPLLGPNTNKILNEEWESVFQDVKPAIGKAVLAVASLIIDNLFDKVPYKYILL